ncbi:MAG: hypothetical protein KIT31_18485 [Deltaproteobacteria bacterium]|nr:hypothetical protein [Deltaproteobacteria bacterium]
MTDDKKPSWWNDKVAASWDKAKATALREWEKLNAATTREKLAPLKAQIAERAMAFGHGARVHAERGMAKAAAWSDALEKELSEEWSKLGNKGEAAWEKVRDTVKAQWQRATDKAPEKKPD